MCRKEGVETKVCAAAEEGAQSIVYNRDGRKGVYIQGEEIVHAEYGRAQGEGVPKYSASRGNQSRVKGFVLTLPTSTTRSYAVAVWVRNLSYDFCLGVAKPMARKSPARDEQVPARSLSERDRSGVDEGTGGEVLPEA